MGFILIEWEFPFNLLRMTLVPPFSNFLQIKGCFKLPELGPGWFNSTSCMLGDIPWELNPDGRK